MNRLKVFTASLLFASISAYASNLSAIMYSANDPFIKNYAQELESLAKKDNTDLRISFSQSDVKVENLNLQKAFSAKSSALIVNLVEPNRALQVANLVYKNNQTPLIYINRKPSEQALKVFDKSYFVGTDASQAGRFQAEMLTEYCLNHEADRNHDGKINYILLEGEAFLDDTIMRSMSLRSSIADSPISFEETIAITADWKADKANYELNQFINQNGMDKIEAIVANNDAMALGALKALQALGYNQGDDTKYIPIIGVDGSEEALTAIANGQLTGTVQNDYKTQAEVAYKLAKLAAENKKIDSKAIGYFIDSNNCIYIPYLKINQSK